MAAGLLIPDVLERMAKHDDGPLIMNGRDDWKDFLDWRDAMDAYWRLLRIDAPSGSVWNLCSGRRTRVSSLVRNILDEQKVERDIRFTDPAVETLVGDPSKLMRATGWAPRHTLQDTVRALFAQTTHRHTMTKTALITGITGQDGSYLAELLLAKGYQVHGIVRRASSFNTDRIDHLHVGPAHPNPDFHLHYGDLSDAGALRNVLDRATRRGVQPRGAEPRARQLRSARIHRRCDGGGSDPPARGDPRLHEARPQAGALLPGQQLRDVRQRQAATAREARRSIRAARTPAPRSMRTAGGNYRESYGMFACNGILFNHESPAAAKPSSPARSRARPRASSWGCRTSCTSATSTPARLGLRRRLRRGDVADAAAGQARRLRHGDRRDDHRPRIPRLTFGQLELDWQDHVEIDPRYFRPAEVDHLEGDSAKCRRILGWEPKTDIRALARMMVDADLRLAERERVLRDAGHEEVPRTGYR